MEPRVLTQTVVDEILADKDLLQELVKGIEVMGIFATAEDVNNQLDEMNKERESQLQDLLSNIPETIVAQKHPSHLDEKKRSSSL